MIANRNPFKKAIPALNCYLFLILVYRDFLTGYASLLQASLLIGLSRSIASFLKLFEQVTINLICEHFLFHIDINKLYESINQVKKMISSK
jgi:hypothetical protein